jgi:hypothetical protein
MRVLHHRRDMIIEYAKSIFAAAFLAVHSISGVCGGLLRFGRFAPSSE